MRLPRSCQFSNERITGLFLVGDSQEGTICVARFDRNSREVELEFIDPVSQQRFSSVRSPDHFHAREIFKMHYSDGTLITTSGDCLMLWSYVNIFDINQCLKANESVRCLEQKSHFRPSGNTPIAQSEVSEDFVVVLLKTGCLCFLSLSTASLVRRIETHSSASGISVRDKTLLVHWGHHIEVFELENFKRVATFISSLRRIVSAQLFDQDTLIILIDSGVVDIVDVSSNRKIASTDLECKIAIASFSLSPKRLIALSNKSAHVDLVNLRNLVESQVMYPNPYFDEQEPVLESASIMPLSQIMHIDREKLIVQYFQLPLNENAFRFLTSSPSLSSEFAFWEKNILRGTSYYKSDKVIARLLKQLAFLSAWNPGFKRYTTFLPTVIFPFVKLFAHRQKLCFELNAFFLINFCRDWFGETQEEIETEINDSIRESDCLLHSHMLSILEQSSIGGFVLEKICWNLITEMLPTSDWLGMLDALASWFHNNHKRSYDDRFIVRIVLEYILTQKQRILEIKDRKELTEWVQTQAKQMPKSPNQIIRSLPVHVRGEPFFLAENAVQYPDFPN